METTWKKRILSFLISFTMALSFMIAIPTPASAWVSSGDAAYYVNITKNKSFTKDGKFNMSFNIKNVDEYWVDIWAKLYNQSGKEIFSWKPRVLHGGKSSVQNFAADYRSLPTGKYTFKLYVLPKHSTQTFQWNFTINQTNKAGISFKSYETYYDKDGYYIHKFNIQCKDMKGNKLTMKIYDEYGSLVMSSTGPARKTNNEVGFFTWSGHNRDEGVKFPTGEYTVIVTGGGKTIEKTYKLKILEVVKG